MKYERIERTLEETIEFCEKNNWTLGKSERDLINGKISPSKYMSYYGTGKDDRSKQFVNLFFKQVEELEKGEWCWFWDDDIKDGLIRKYKKSIVDSKVYHINENGFRYSNCISIKEFRKRLKEYL